MAGVIGRVYRGRKVGGLVRYLYGPGRHNEHENPHLVASWSGCTPRELAVVEPEWTGVGERDYRGLVAELEAPARYAERGSGTRCGIARCARPRPIGC